MSVFVGVEVGDVDAGTLELLYLGEGFTSDVLFADPATQEGLNEIDERGSKGFAIGAYECGDAFWVRSGDAVGEDDVTAYAEGWVGVGDGYGVIERSAGGHERGRGESFGLMELCDGAVDAGSEAEVVRVDDESEWHRRSRWPCLLQQGEALKTAPGLSVFSHGGLRMDVQCGLQWSVAGGRTGRHVVVARQQLPAVLFGVE